MASTRTILPGLLASALALFLIGCNQEMVISDSFNGFVMSHFIVLYPILWVLILLITNHLQKWLLDEPLCEDDWKYKDESPEMIALMVQHSYGYTTEYKFRLALLILTRLLAENRIQFIDKGKFQNPYKFSETFIMPANPFDAAVCKIIESALKFNYISIESQLSHF